MTHAEPCGRTGRSQLFARHGFLDRFNPEKYRGFHDKVGGLQWIIPTSEFDEFNSFIDHGKTVWVRWKKGVDFSE